MEEFTCIIRRGLTDSASRKLIINDTLVKFEDKNETNNTFTTFLKTEITDYRFGIYWLRLDLTFGRQYKIFIRNKENKVLKITFKSYFSYKSGQLFEQYSDILDSLWKFHFGPMTDEYLLRFENEDEFSIGNVRFSSKGLTIKGNIIDWQDVRTSNYHTYFAIYSHNDPSKINYQYSYMDDWNTTVLYSTLRSILRFKNIETYN